MKTNINLIKFLIDNDLIRQYAVFLKLKHIHSNGRVYDYSPYKLSKQSGLSRTSIVKYIAFFKEQNWIRIEKNDIIFISIEKLKALYEIKLKFDIKIKKTKTITITSLVNSLRYESLKHKQSQFKHSNQIRKDQSNPQGKGSLKRYKKALKKTIPKTFGEFSNYLKISVKKLALLINKSTATVSRLIKVKGAKVIRGKQTIMRLKRNIHLPHNMYWNKGFVVKVECNSYFF